MACPGLGDFPQCSLQNPEELLQGSWEPQKEDAHNDVHVSRAEIWIWLLKVRVSRKSHKGTCHISADGGWKKLLRLTGTWS